MVSKKQNVSVFVGLSGGVDSSVSVALLKKAGYDVTGVFIKVWQADFIDCDWKSEMRDAMRVCAELDIPFIKLDLSREYKKEVIDYMIREYKAGRTPNPDVMCNRVIKFGSFLKFAMKNGADFIATGHYARVMEHGTWNIKHKVGKKKNAPCFMLHASCDSAKDQSYFLWTLTQEDLRHTLFPVGGMIKPEVRKLAKKFGLSTAEKKDSQGLCFIGKVDVKDFLKNYIKEKKGKVLDTTGKVVGTHDGAVFYTIGERHGFTVTDSVTMVKPSYLVAKNIKKNTITVSHKMPISVTLLSDRKILITNVNWISGVPPKPREKLWARIRYRQPLEKCRVKVTRAGAEATFAKSLEGITPGQSLVLYKGSECLGGGVIDSVL